MSYSLYPKGSEWRKWDLHLHSPKSGLANQFPMIGNEPDWEKYLVALEALTEMPVIGVTDYFSIEGYKKLQEFKASGRLPNISLLLPNIEFRLDNLVGTKRVNFHVIFSDKLTPEEIEDGFLSNLEITIEGSAGSPSDMRKLKRSSLEELGKTYKAQHAVFNGRSDYEIGCMTAVANLGKMMDILTRNSLFKDKYITALAEENTGLMNWDGQDHGVRKVILQSSHIVFSANPNTVAWCLGKKHSSPKDFVAEFKSLKACAIGSDAHELDKVGEPPNGKFTWIKADTTFDGLRQIIFEPEDRIYIGSTAPDEKDRAKIIKSLTIKDGNGWFAEQTVELNKDLVAIIGGKGSGKTALLDLLAYSGGDFDFENSEAFLNKASEEISGTKLILTWADGKVESTCEVHDDATYPAEAKVRYLSQSFVENLCSFDQHETLVRQIENILFQYVANDKKMGAKDFNSLKEIKTRSLQLEIDKIESRLQKLNEEIFNLEVEIAGKPDLVKEGERLAKEKIDLEAQKPTAANAEEEKEQEQLQKLRDKKSVLERSIEGHRLMIATIEEFRTRTRILRTEVETFNSEIKKHLKEWGLQDESSNFAFGIPERSDELLKGKISGSSTFVMGGRVLRVVLKCKNVS